MIRRPPSSTLFPYPPLSRSLLHPLDAALGAPWLAVELERHPAVVGLHVGAPDVDDDVEVLHEPVDDRLLHEVRRKRQTQAQARRRAHRAQWPPAMAGTMDTWSPSFSAVFFDWRNRMSSSLT